MTQPAVSAKLYLVIWGWLAGLMLLGVFISELPLSKSAIVLIVLALSSIKAVLVGLYYMHLQSDRRVLALIVLSPLVLLLLVAGLLWSSHLVRL